MVTPELKDKVLEHIIANADDMEFSGKEKDIAALMEAGPNEIQAILRQFHLRGFIKYQQYMTGGTDFSAVVEAKAHDYYGLGGHVGEFRMLELEFEKLKIQILSLEKQYGKENLRDLLSVSNTLISFFQTFYNR